MDPIHPVGSGISVSSSKLIDSEQGTASQSIRPELGVRDSSGGTVAAPTKSGASAAPSAGAGGCCGRERLKRHWVEVAGRVWIPEIWGQEELLKDWIDCAGFDSAMPNTAIISARASLIEESRRARSTGLGIENSC